MRHLLCAVLALLLVGCGGSQSPVTTTQTPPTPVLKTLDKVVFIGDSLTRLWEFPRYFPNTQYVNKGVSGERTDQMLLRFQTDVIDLHPDAVMIWAGANDLANHISVDTAESNFKQMADTARANNIVVIICTLTPRYSSGVWANPSFVDYNSRLTAYAKLHNLAVADYYSATAGSDGALQSQYAWDPVNDVIHLSYPGYDAITKVAKAAIQDARAR